MFPVEFYMGVVVVIRIVRVVVRIKLNKSSPVLWFTNPLIPIRHVVTSVSYNVNSCFAITRFPIRATGKTRLLLLFLFYRTTNGCMEQTWDKRGTNVDETWMKHVATM